MSVEVYKERPLYHSVQRIIHSNQKFKEKNQNCRCLVILHLFYNSSWKEIHEYLKNLEAYHVDLIVTVTKNLIKEETVETVLNDYPDAKIIWCENKGFDLLPFFIALKDVDLDQYDVVFKIHSKSTKRKSIYIYKQLFFRRDWFLFLYDGILSAKNAHKTVDLLLNNPEIGLVAAENLIVQDPPHKQHLVIKAAEEYGYEINSDYRFVAGTCFAVKAECLKPLQQRHYENQDFSNVSVKRGMSFAHFIERYMCDCVRQQGYQLYGNPTDSLRRNLYLKPLSKVVGHYSSERLFDEDLNFDDEWFYWQMDNRLIKWKYDEVRICDLKYSGEKEVISLLDGAAYQYLKGDLAGYEEYCRMHQRNGLPVMSKERFDRLIESIEQNGYDPRQIIIIDENNVLLDGQHRACVLAKKYGEDYTVRVLRIVKLKKYIKSRIPPAIMNSFRSLRNRS